LINVFKDLFFKELSNNPRRCRRAMVQAKDAS